MHRGIIIKFLYAGFFLIFIETLVSYTNVQHQYDTLISKNFMYKIIQFLSLLLATFFQMVITSSCDRQEETDFSPDYNDQEFIENNESKVDDKYIKDLINEYVTVKAQYVEYMWIFTIESTLHHQLKNKNIEFCLGHGDLGGGIEYMTNGEESYDYSSKNDGKKKTMIFTNPYWFYYIWGMEPSDKENWTLSELNYASYKFLQEKGEDHLTQYEKISYKQLIESLNNLEKPARIYYKPSIQVHIDSKYYLVSRYTLK